MGEHFVVKRKDEFVFLQAKEQLGKEMIATCYITVVLSVVIE